jgi:NAD(P)H dehydrogenase (quinone)
MGSNRARHHKNAIDAAKRAGGKHIVYTSAVNPVPQSRFERAPAHAGGSVARLGRRLHDCCRPRCLSLIYSTL